MPAIVENVVYQHAENVCSLWLQRQQAVDEPHYSFSDLVHLDNRVEANLEGLRIAGEHGLPFIEEMIKAEDEGAYFAKAFLALEREDLNTFNELLEMAESNKLVLSELESSLAWINPAFLKSTVKTLLSSNKSAAIILGLRTCASHNRDPERYLDKHLLSKDPEVRTTVLRVAANLANRSVGEKVLHQYRSETENEAFEEARNLAFMGKQTEARTKLNKIAMSDSPNRTRAVNLSVQLEDKNSGRALLKELDAAKERDRDVIRGFGLLGDPVAMNWLINKTEIPEFSRLAGGSITMITGIDLAEQDLETLDEPEGFADGGIDDNPENDNVDLDEDENLPWPDTTLIRQWWDSSAKLPNGKSHLDGREKTVSELQHVLVTGMQRQRNAAATALALSNPETAYCDTRLPTSRQKTWAQ